MPPAFRALGSALRFDGAMLHVSLTDGREISVRLASHPKLAAATHAQLGNWRWIGGGVGIHWPDLDEDLSVRGLPGLGVNQPAEEIE